MSSTRLKKRLEKLLTGSSVSAQEVLHLLREEVRERPEALQEIFPNEEFAGSVKVRMPASLRRDQLSEQAHTTNDVKRDRRDNRRRRVVAYLDTHAPDPLLTLNEKVAILNRSSIRPARGTEWSIYMLHRLLNEPSKSEGAHTEG